MAALVTYQNHFISFTNKVLALDSGSQEFFGTPERLFKECAVAENIDLLSKQKKFAIELDFEEKYLEILSVINPSTHAR